MIDPLARETMPPAHGKRASALPPCVHSSRHTISHRTPADALDPPFVDPSLHAAGRRSNGSSNSSHRLPRPPPVVVVPPPSPPAAPPTTSSSLDPVDFDGKIWLYRDYVWLAIALGLSPQGYLLGTLGLALGLKWEWCLAAAFAAAVLSALLASATCESS